MDGAHWACAGCSVGDSTIRCWETNNLGDEQSKRWQGGHANGRPRGGVGEALPVGERGWLTPHRRSGRRGTSQLAK